MKKIITLLVFALNTLLACAQLQWASSGPSSNTFPPAASVTSLAAIDSVIFAGTNPEGVDYGLKGIYYSTSQGGYWQLSTSSFAVNSLFAQADTLYAGGDGVHYSKNKGHTWTAAGLSQYNVMSILALGNTLIAGTQYNGIYVSVNKGATWTASVGYNTYTLITDNHYVYAAGAYGLFRSADTGATWSNITNGITYDTAGGIFCVAANNGYLYVGTEYGIYRSANNGSNWTEVVNGIPYNIPGGSYPSCTALAFNGDTMFMSSSACKVYFSVNHGDLWTQLNISSNGVPYDVTTSLFVCNGMLYDGTYQNGVWQVPVSISIAATTDYIDTAFCNSLCTGEVMVTPSGGFGNYTYRWNTSPVQTTQIAHSLCPGNTYNVTITDAQGDSGVVIINIPAGRAPVHSVDTATICSGQNINGHTAAGNYSDTLATVLGCDSIVALHLTVIPSPQTPVITRNGDTLTASSPGAVSWQWFNNNHALAGDTESIYATQTAGNYTVQVTGNNGCKATSAGINTDINSLILRGTVTIWPNPFNNYIIVDFNSTNIASAVINVYDLTGRMLETQNVQLTPGTQQINAGSLLPAGSYLLQVTTADNKMIKNMLVLKVE